MQLVDRKQATGCLVAGAAGMSLFFLPPPQKKRGSLKVLYYAKFTFNSGWFLYPFNHLRRSDGRPIWCLLHSFKKKKSVKKILSCPFVMSQRAPIPHSKTNVLVLPSETSLSLSNFSTRGRSDALGLTFLRKQRGRLQTEG